MIQLVAALLLLLVFAAAVLARRSDRSSRVLAAPSPATAPTGDALDRVVAVLRRKPVLRSGMSLLSLGMLVAAIGFLGYPAYTNFQHDRLQQKLHRELATPQARQAFQSGAVGEGDALTRIVIPKLRVDTVVVEGTTQSALRAGAGHYPTTPLPCEGGNVGIAGHRTTYGKPFNAVDLLVPGDKIELHTPVGTCTYVVDRKPYPVDPSDVSVVAPGPGATLTLTTCHPKGSAAQRLVVKAHLEGAPVG
jgi:sortase A